MDTRNFHGTLIAAAAALAAPASIASAGPRLVLERVAAPDSGERYAVGIEARAFCMRLVAESTGHSVRIAAPNTCTFCRKLSA